MAVREDPGLRRHLWRPMLVAAWAVAVAVAAFVLTGSAAAATARHAEGAKSAHSNNGGDPRFAADTNAAEAQYGHHERHEHQGPVSPSESGSASTTTSTQAGLPFTGENVLEVIALGLLLGGGGLLLSRRLRGQT